MLTKASCCKVNLLLNILGKRADGFHELETLMHPVPLFDQLSFERVGTGIQLTCSDPNLPTDGKNLIVRAADLFANAAGIGPNDGVRIHLEKMLPVAAGIGGGSGNAAATFLAMNELFGQPLPAQRVWELAAGLGSDIPFFLQNGPALATGRGEFIEPLSPFETMRGAWFILVHPGFGISTPWAYQQLAKFPEAVNGKPGRARQLADLLRKDLPGAAKSLYNSLEAPALWKYPLLELFQEFFREQGVLGTLMSGSGSATFALAASQASAQGILEKFKAKFGTEIWTAAVPAM